MAVEPLVLAVNPGSASKKYALYKGKRLIADVHFEYEAGKVVCSIADKSGVYAESGLVHDLPEASESLLGMFRARGYLKEGQTVDGIGIRVVAPTSYFLEHRFLDEAAVRQLESLVQRAPLHIGATLAEVKELQKNFVNVPIFAVSDSAFHAEKPDYAWNYGISLDLADTHEIKRFGFHGISVESIVQTLSSRNLLEEKVIVCHLGSGSSVTAVLTGRSIETTMGYSPLEGLIMATRSGSIDTIASHELKRVIGGGDHELEELLNHQSGLLGISGFSNDIRELLVAEEEGSYRAGLALNMFAYHVQQAIGRMAAVLDGADTLVFTGTVGARSVAMRERIANKLSYLNFAIKPDLNAAAYEPKTPTRINPRTRQKNIYVITTDEAYEIAWRTQQALKKLY